MATLVKSLLGNSPHLYHADAEVLSANLEQPLDQEIKPQARVVLPEDGHYQFQHAEPFRLKGIISYQSGYTQVAGHPATKGKGFQTLATSVVEGLNVLDVLTADRVVGQISTVHPEEGQVPSVTFLGTRFENLRIDGRGVEVERHLEILGDRKEDDTSYFDDQTVLGRFSQQYEKISKADGLPGWAGERYPKDRAAWQTASDLRCSVVNRVKDAPGTSFGHVIDLPDFGRIFLGELKVNRVMGRPATKGDDGANDTYRFNLTMIRLEMGCLARGTATIVALDSNGGGKGSPPPPPK
jgi:hypothetical protein